MTAGLIGQLIPPPAATEESFGDPGTPPELFPEEEELLTRAVEKRRREFGTVRACARTALERLGGPRVPLLPGERGAPGWPEGFVGSMTHCDGYRAAAVARSSELLTLGLDAEPNEPIASEGVLEMVTLPDERDRIPRLAAVRPDVAWDRMLFSAKESVYKAWFPLARRWLDFDEARLTVDPAAGTFTAELLVPGPTVHGEELTGFTGRWLAADGFVVTAIALPQQTAPLPAQHGQQQGRADADAPAS